MKMRRSILVALFVGLVVGGSLAAAAADGDAPAGSF
jgi:hypothetical protein